MDNVLLPLAVLCAVIFANSVDARLVHAAVIPHGDFALDPSLVHNANGSLLVHDAAIQAGAMLEAHKPDLVLLTTPHGIELSSDYALYMNTNASGFAQIGADLHNASFPGYKVPLSVGLDPDVAAAILKAGGDEANNVSGLLAFADSEPVALRWGEVVPMWFFKSLLQNGSKAAVLSIPTRRYTEDIAMIPGLLKLGASVGRMLEALDKRVAVVISSDLAHTHLASGPYGKSVAAEPFDLACGRWAGSLEAEPLLVDAIKYVDAAKSCGFTGMVFLHGLLSALKDDGISWTPELLANEHPTYYGMLVAQFTRGSAN